MTVKALGMTIKALGMTVKAMGMIVTAKNDSGLTGMAVVTVGPLVKSKIYILWKKL